MPLEIWTAWWANALFKVGLTIVIALVGRAVLVWAIRRAVGAMVERAERHRAVLPGRAGRILSTTSGWDLERQLARTRTLGSMLTSVATATIVLISLLTILNIVGLPMAPLLTSAGVGGIAIAFGAQTLIKDFISGVFLIAEDQFGVGDVVNLGEVSGTVEEVTLRVTRVRDANGQVWYVRNGEIIKVGNVSQGWSNATVDIGVHYESDPTQVIEIIKGVVAEMDADPVWKDQLLETPSVLGVESIQGQTMTIRVIAKCAANQQWGVQRELRERAKRALDEAGVKGPGLAWPPRH